MNLNLGLGCSKLVTVETDYLCVWKSILMRSSMFECSSMMK